MSVRQLTWEWKEKKRQDSSVDQLLQWQVPASGTELS